MTTGYELEEQEITAVNSTEVESEVESDITTSKQSDDAPVVETLYFWAEPGVCG